MKLVLGPIFFEMGDELNNAGLIKHATRNNVDDFQPGPTGPVLRNRVSIKSGTIFLCQR